MESLLAGLPVNRNGRALEVAAGDARLSRHLLTKLFTAIDCFDQCPVAVRRIERLKVGYDAIKNVDQATMQSFTWEKTYAVIVLRWCIGYLTDGEVTQFLRKA